MPLFRFTLSPEDRVLRQFGWVACAAGLLVAALVPDLWARALAVVGLIAAACSVVRPSLNRPLFVVLSAITYPVGYVLSIVVLVTLFYVVVTPVGLLRRLLGADPLARRFEGGAASYWTTARGRRPKADYFRQY